MDNVQFYTAAYITITTLVSLLQVIKEDDPKARFIALISSVLAYILAVPFFGRIFGWW